MFNIYQVRVRRTESGYNELDTTGTIDTPGKNIIDFKSLDIGVLRGNFILVNKSSRPVLFNFEGSLGQDVWLLRQTESSEI